MVRRTPPTRQSPPEDARARILQAAAQVFSEAGYQAATVRQICARASTNIALVNYYFGAKMGLYTEVLRQSMRSSHVDAIREALDRKGSPEDILRGIIKARLRSFSNGDLAQRQFRILIHELAQPTPALGRVINDLTRPIYTRVLQLIGSLIGLPASDETTRLCCHSVMGQVMHYVLASPVLVRLWPELRMTPAQLDRIADHIADFSLAYLRQLGRERRKRATPENGRNCK